MFGSKKKKATRDPQAELVATIVEQATDVKAFGGGMASNVMRFLLPERAKNSSSLLIESRAGRDPGFRDYVFYVRMNTCSAEAFQAVRDFYQRVVSHVCSTATWRSIVGPTGQRAKPLIPRVLLGVERAQAELFDVLGAWSEKCHREIGKTFNRDMLFSSISVVEGTVAQTFKESSLYTIPTAAALTAHMAQLGLVHAIDVAIGMGDRLQNPNVGNVTVHPGTHQLVVIDVDSFLPPLAAPREVRRPKRWMGSGDDGGSRGGEVLSAREMIFDWEFNEGCGPSWARCGKTVWKNIEKACRMTSEDFDSGDDAPRNNEAWALHYGHWFACPPRIPLQGDYAASVEDALQNDLAHYLEGGLKSDYVTRVGLGGEAAVGLRQMFLDVALFTLKEIKAGVMKGTLPLKVEDETCSQARLRQRVGEWTFRQTWVVGQKPSVGTGGKPVGGTGGKPVGGSIFKPGVKPRTKPRGPFFRGSRGGTKSGGAEDPK